MIKNPRRPEIRADVYKFRGRWHADIRDRWSVIDIEDFPTWTDAMRWVERMLTP